MEQGQGDGRSLGIEQLPISQLPLLNTGITEQAAAEESECLSPSLLSFFLASFRYLFPNSSPHSLSYIPILLSLSSCLSVALTFTLCLSPSHFSCL